MKNIKHVIGTALMTLFVVGCGVETPKQDAEGIGSTANYPVVTLTSDVENGSTISEGSTTTYTLTLDRQISSGITFTPTVVGGTADGDDITELEPVTIEKYTSSVSFDIVTADDYLIEEEETLEIEVEIASIGEKNLVHPSSVLQSIDHTIAAVADPTLLTINFAWDNDLDMDMLTFSDVYGLWGTGGAGSHNPEIDHAIWLADPPGDYYVTVLDWGEGVDFNYTITVNHPDNSVETFTGVFDATNYPYDSFAGPASWGYPNCYKMLKVVNDGTSFVVTAL
jgi:hypothetical protein